MGVKDILAKEAEAFDKQADERLKHGFIPDLRRLQKVDWFYNNVWREPEFVEIHYRKKIDFVLNIAKQKGGKIIELGCGYGYLSLELARNGLEVIGVDLSPKSIEIAQKFAADNPFKDNFGSLKYICGDILSIDIGKNEFDNVVFFSSLHHLPNVDLVLSKVQQALKRGGNLIICEPIADNFTKDSAEFAAILRAVLPTWIPYEEKLRDLDNSESWDKYVEQIYNEYTYKEKYEQSPSDNITSSEKVILDAVRKYFSIKTIEYSDAFIDKLIGGLRGENRFRLARFLEFLDEELIKRKIVPPTSIRLHAVRQQGF